MLTRAQSSHQSFSPFVKGGWGGLPRKVQRPQRVGWAVPTTSWSGWWAQPTLHFLGKAGGADACSNPQPGGTPLQPQAKGAGRPEPPGFVGFYQRCSSARNIRTSIPPFVRGGSGGRGGQRPARTCDLEAGTLPRLPLKFLGFHHRCSFAPLPDGALSTPYSTLTSLPYARTARTLRILP